MHETTVVGTDLTVAVQFAGHCFCTRRGGRQVWNCPSRGPQEFRHPLPGGDRGAQLGAFLVRSVRQGTANPHGQHEHYQLEH